MTDSAQIAVSEDIPKADAKDHTQVVVSEIV